MIVQPTAAETDSLSRDNFVKNWHGINVSVAEMNHSIYALLAAEANTSLIFIMIWNSGHTGAM